VATQSGFAVIVVVFLLFAIGVSAATTYQVVRLEDTLAGLASDSERAGVAAAAGAMAFLGAAVRGVPGDTVFTVDDGTAYPPEVQVMARRMVDAWAWEDLYVVRSRGRVTDPRFFAYPALREVVMYARLRTPPLERIGALVSTAFTSVSIGPSFTVSGNDAAPNGACDPAGTDIPGLARGSSSLSGGGNVQGGDTSYGSPAAVLAALALPDWSSLASPDYRADYEFSGSTWTFPSVGPGVYPVIRVSGDMTASGTKSGRGVLIVTGQLVLGDNFSWDGIVLAGDLGSSTASGTEVRGILIGGVSTYASTLSLSGGGPGPAASSIRYHSCNVLDAGRSMGVLNPEPQSWWSGY
jgi:hypothetical protein